MRPLVVFASVPFSEEEWQQLRAVAPDVRIRQAVGEGASVVEDHIADAEVAVIYGHQDFDPVKAPNLRWVLTASAGVDALIGGQLWNSPVQIVNASGIHAYSIAELVFAMILALRHRLPYLLRAQQEHRWAQREPQAQPAGELHGLTMGVIGYGSIGREVGRLAKAFGMRLLATTIDPKLRADTGFRLPGAGDPEGVLPDMLGGPDFQHELLRQSDIVVVCVPSAPHTRHLLAADELASMKQGALLINVARGAVVDEEALVQALRNGHLGGAGLDVFAQEPLPQESPLWDMENVIITPHIAGASPLYWRRLMMLLVENVRRYLAGQPLLNVVDKRVAF